MTGSSSQMTLQTTCGHRRMWMSCTRTRTSGPDAASCTLPAAASSHPTGVSMTMRARFGRLSLLQFPATKHKLICTWPAAADDMATTSKSVQMLMLRHATWLDIPLSPRVLSRLPAAFSFEADLPRHDWPPKRARPARSAQ